MKRSSDFRKEARSALKGNWGKAVAAGFVASILGAAGNGILDFGFNSSTGSASMNMAGMDVYSVDLQQITESGMGGILAGIVGTLFAIALLIALIQLIIGFVVAAGYSKFNMNLVDGEESRVGNLFEYFPHWKTMLKAGLLQVLFVILWSMLFVIPGIIAAIRYSMTYYILAENPEMTAREAIDRSKEMMNGNKWRLFCLGFSFIGWEILSAITMGIGHLFLYPYEYAAMAAFYREISGTAVEKEETLSLQEPAMAE